MNASDIMTRKLISVMPDTTIVEAARLMLKHHVSGLPVTDGSGAIVGIITEGDLLHRAETGTERRHPRWLDLILGPGHQAHDYADSHARKVGEVMTTDIAWVSPEEPLEGVVEAMDKRRIKRVPVIENCRLVGIVSRADLVRALVQRLSREEKAAAKTISDTNIHKTILAIIEKEPWAPRYSVDVTVKNGVVELRGAITDERARAALTVAAENVPGVKQVRNHLAWVEPNSGLVIPAAGDVEPQ
jgi:CBS domain-containing protein